MATPSAYVKFQRGSSTAFENLKKKSNDTLYFVKNDKDKLDLYLGEEKINGAEADSISLSSLQDTSINEAETFDILIYKDQTWRNQPVKSLDQILSIHEVMSGASDTEDGKAGLVPTPKKGLQKHFLRGDGEWVDIDLITKEIVNSSISELVGGAPSAFDTLGEIAEWIEKDESGSAQLITKVGSLSETLSDLTEKANNTTNNLNAVSGRVSTLEQLINSNGNGGIISDIVSIKDFMSKVGNISDLGKPYSSTEEKTLINEINLINEKLIWQKFSKK